MKVCLLLFALLAVAHCLTTPAPEHHDALARLIFQEVKAIMHADNTLDEAGCTAKCDAEFALTGHHSEATADSYCAEECHRFFTQHQQQPAAA